MDAAEAKSLGLADEVTSEKKMAANFSLRLLPPAAAERFRAETGTGQGDPPLTDRQPEDPEPQPPAAPGSPLDLVVEGAQTVVPPTGEVIDLNAAKQQGVNEHKAYVAAVTDLCTLASCIRSGWQLRARRHVGR